MLRGLDNFVLFQLIKMTSQGERNLDRSDLLDNVAG